MKTTLRRAMSALLGAAMLLTLLAVPAAAEEKPTLWIVGDSTVCEFADAYYYPRYGYGTQIGNYLDGTYNVQNLALSGRSSKSFLAEANYTTLKNGIRAGDALIIGFGHNDEKYGEEDRYTDPNGDWQTAGSFAECLWTNYVKLAQDNGAEAVLCTPIVRRNGDNDTLSSSNKHVTAQGDYPAAIRQLGQDKNATVVDLTAKTAELYETVGAAETLKFHARTNSKASSVDNTHLNIYGAMKVAYMLAQDLQQNGPATLKTHIDLTAGEPTEAALPDRSGWVDPPYEAPADDAATIWDNYVAGTQVFKPTVFGVVGSISKDENFYKLETTSDGDMRIAALENKSKVASTQDGFAMYYVKVPVGSQIEFSAKATVNAFNDTDSNKKQAAFGLMARDDMYIDTVDPGIASDYVVAGSTGAGVNCFRRKDGKLTYGSSLSAETLAADSSYDLRIVSNSDGYACTFGKETTQTGGFDFQLTTVDSEYFYIGMFCSRSFDVTFSEIYLKVDGVVLCAPPFTFAVDSWGFQAADGTASDRAVAGGTLASVRVASTGVNDEAMALVAVYNAQGKMTGLKVLPVKDGDLPVGLKMNEGETAKVFLLGRSALAPIQPVIQTGPETTQ